jgi:predicted ABC-class ATPase
VDDRQLESSRAVPFVTPDSLRVTLEAPNAGAVSGLGIPAGVTLIVGGGFHGKSTLLNALERSVYNHLPGDGRERVVTVPQAVKIRAEDRRYVNNVDISDFIGELPGGIDTHHFSSLNASGSTSQAANIVEALELGCRALLIDEDTSATNFMTRDQRMEALVPAVREPITPFSRRVAELRGLGLSTVCVMGGSGDFFDVADTVIVLDEYVPSVQTERAKRIAEDHPRGPTDRVETAFELPGDRRVVRASLDSSRGRRDRVRAHGTRLIAFGEEEIDVSLLGQLVHDAQTRTLADWMHRYARTRGDDLELRTLCEQLEDSGWDLLSEACAAGFGDRVLARRFELGAAINRLRSLRIASERP